MVQVWVRIHSILFHVSSGVSVWLFSRRPFHFPLSVHHFHSSSDLFLVNFIFCDLVDKFFGPFRHWGPRHFCRVRPSHRIWAQRLPHRGARWTLHRGILDAFLFFSSFGFLTGSQYRTHLVLSCSVGSAMKSTEHFIVFRIPKKWDESSEDFSEDMGHCATWKFMFIDSVVQSLFLPFQERRIYSENQLKEMFVCQDFLKWINGFPKSDFAIHLNQQVLFLSCWASTINGVSCCHEIKTMESEMSEYVRQYIFLRVQSDSRSSSEFKIMFLMF